MNFKDLLNTLRTSDSFWISLTRDILSVLLLVGIFLLLSQIIFGMWTPMVVIESGSMEPNMNIGDIVFIKSIDRVDVITHSQGEGDYVSFGDYGDVILYRPLGDEDATPIIHRSMYHVEEGEPMWEGGPPAPHNGYITKGDNPVTNRHFDQQGRISYLQPVREEWVIGIAKYRIPYIGHVRLLFN
ncbi:peptidase S26B, signal peptidase [Methanosalsum zhilinae DSM 4017]|uniref:Peptidase S26B, signal peptidase n=1 Tax=Methanosalsum zhilinae (strain DSM 4017 / NBRC 107636 / OCM 62 / WeN5) TaxID=679901 RepID=F7XMG0_METZD|nr:S26 family signal peptidase [Methanosalsum zhilinae]AEH59883.1 peptidase S26B, signal peptidase [Methanosalsum zhilinae DSM 4017]